jgi:hypothetical protein
VNIRDGRFDDLKLFIRARRLRVRDSGKARCQRQCQCDLQVSALHDFLLAQCIRPRGCSAM